MENSRNHALLSMLERDGGWMTASTLAAKLNCSTRTVSTAVSRINDHDPALVLSGGRGYRLNATRALDATPQPTLDAPQSAAERKSLILRKLLLQHHVVDLLQIAAELCISPATLDNELTALRSDLAAFGLSLHVKGGSLYVMGAPADEKKMIGNLIYTETKDFFNQLELISGYFPNINLRRLREDLDAILTRHDLSINGYALSNLILHVAILLERELNGLHTDDTAREAPRNLSNVHVLRSVDEICALIRERYGVAFSPGDRCTVEIILLASLTVRGPQMSARLIDRSVSRLVGAICDRVREAFSIDLADDDFKIRFALHLENVLKRDQLDMRLRNPQLATIKNDYPFIYDISVFMADIVREQTGTVISEDEIAFIALHIGCLIEEQGEGESRLRALLVCPSAPPGGARLLRRISASLGSRLKIQRIVENPDGLADLIRACAPIDLVIATQRIRARADIPIVEVSPFLGERDTALIAARIESIARRRVREAMSANLRTFFREELFFCDLPLTRRDDAITRLADALIARGCVRPDFKAELFDREQISSSAYRSVAVPHPLTMSAHTTAVAVLLCPRGIEWGGSTVRIVIMLAIRKEDTTLYRDLFTYISKVLIKGECTRALARAGTFDEFVDLMLDFAERR